MPGDDPSAMAAACCAEFYEQDWVRTLLGDSFHPGGEALSHRLIEDLRLAPKDRVLDIACGTGTTALMLIDRYDVHVTGLDFSKKNLERARRRAAARSEIRFVQGSAEDLPFESGAFDALICECAVSTFADKKRVASEVARVLKPGGRFAMSDMAVYGALPEDLAAFGRGWSCVDDALTIEGYLDLFRDAGLTELRVVDESPALREMVVLLKKKLLLVGLGQVSGVLEEMDVDLATLRHMLERARSMVDAERVRYGRLGFSRGAPASTECSAERMSPVAVKSVECDPTGGCC